MKWMWGIAALILALSTLALADNSADFHNSRATLSGSSAANSIPNTVIFNGAFSRPVAWSEAMLADGTRNYAVQGNIRGTRFNGQKVVGATVELTLSTGAKLFRGSRKRSGEDTNCRTVVPEPGTLGLLGAGLVGLAGVLRLKAKS